MSFCNYNQESDPERALSVLAAKLARNPLDFAVDVAFCHILNKVFSLQFRKIEVAYC